MPWNLLILPLIGGYYVMSQSNYFKFAQQRLDRQRLIFDSIIAGLILLVSTFILRKIVSYILPDVIPAFYEFFSVKTPYIGTAFCSFLLGVIVTFGGNYLVFSDHKYQIQKAIKRIGNELELLLESSLKHSYPLEFTLENDKVYIGLVKELPIPRVTTYIRIIPFFSGYRDQEKRLHFTTNYLPVYSE